MTARQTFQPTITASTWPNVWRATRAAAQRRRGVDKHGEPALSNGDAVALVAAWTRRVGPSNFRLWYQFAAAAYGWNAKRRDVLDASASRRATAMPGMLSREVWNATEALADALDRTDVEPRLDIEDGAFDDPVFQASVKACLVEDGAVARLRPRRRGRVGDVGGKIPLCVKPKLGCRPGFKLEQPSPGVFVCRNEKTGEVEQPSMQCEEVVFVDDPLTFAGNELGKLVLLIIGAVIVVNALAHEGARKALR